MQRKDYNGRLVECPCKVDQFTGLVSGESASFLHGFPEQTACLFGKYANLLTIFENYEFPSLTVMVGGRQDAALIKHSIWVRLGLRSVNRRIDRRDLSSSKKLSQSIRHIS